MDSPSEVTVTGLNELGLRQAWWPVTVTAHIFPVT